MYNANLISGIDGENVPKMAIIYQENPIADVALVNGVICQDGAAVGSGLPHYLMDHK